MDEITDTSRMRRSRKMKDKIKELESEIKLLRVNTMEVLEKCSGTVGKVENIESHEDYLNAYTSVYSCLCKYTTFYSNVNGDLELLLSDKEKEEFDIKNSSGSKSEGFRETVSFELSETLKDFRATEILRNSEKVEEFTSNSAVDSVQPTNDEVHEMDENNSFFGPVLENNNNNISSETGNVNVSQIIMDKNYRSTFVNTGINPADIFQYDRRTVPQNFLCPALPFIDTELLLRKSFPQCLNIPNLPPSVCPREFSNSAFSFRPSDKLENGILSKEENPDSESSCKGNLKPFEIDRSVGSFHDIYLTSLISPDEFYARVRNMDLNVQMSKMMEDIKKFTGSGSVKIRNYHDKSLSFRDKKYLASMEFKRGYALGYSKDQWSRLEIVDFRLKVEDDLVKVFYLDNGRTELLSLENIQPMDEVFMKYPLLVQKFYLPFILPGNKEWSQKDIIMFEILTDAADVKFQLKVEITENDKNRKDSALGVNLIIPEFGIIVNKKLVEYGVAVLNPERNSTSTN